MHYSRVVLVPHTSITCRAADSADFWFENLQTKAHAFVYGQKQFYKNYPIDGNPYPPVKIAVIDSGLSMNPATRPPSLVKKHLRQIKHNEYISFVPAGISTKGSPASYPHSSDKGVDLLGHGTYVTILTLEVCPNAHVYVARVVGDSKDKIDPSAVAKAIHHAVQEWKVDIISISLGWDVEHEDIVTQLNHAVSNNVIVFAATSNYGASSQTGVMFPASKPQTLSVDSADGKGDPASGNPPRKKEVSVRLMAPGQQVLSAWPLTMAGNGARRMCGASVATPIAAGIAGLILEFARQPPLGCQPHIAEKIKEPSVMRSILLSLFAEDVDFYSFLRPWKVFYSRDDPYGGDAFDTRSPRYDAGQSIIHHLSSTHQGIKALSVEELLEYSKKHTKYPAGL